MKALAKLQASVVAHAALPPSALPAEDVASLVLECSRAAEQLRGIASRALACVEVDNPAWWLRDSLGISGEAAAAAVRRSESLSSLPLVEDAVVSGDLTLEQAGALGRLVGALPLPDLLEGQSELIEDARGRTVDSVHLMVRSLIAAHSPEALEAEQATAADKRLYRAKLHPDGTVRGRFVIPAPEYEAVATVLEPLARRDWVADARTADQRRCDAFVEVFLGASRWADLPHAGGERARIAYVLPAEWAAGLPGAVPAGGAWSGPATRPLMEALLCDARISRVLLDASGQVSSLQAVKDKVTRAQRRAVSARDGGCVARGCHRPPAFTDVHHLVSLEDGGPTEVGNLVLLCRRHHVMWHAGVLGLHQLRVPWLRTPLDPPQVA